MSNAQTNWNVFSGSSFSNGTLFDSTGAGTTAILSGAAAGIFHGEHSFASPAGNTNLGSGEI
jgi:hypothetical protein